MEQNDSVRVRFVAECIHAAENTVADCMYPACIYDNVVHLQYCTIFHSRYVCICRQFLTTQLTDNGKTVGHQATDVAGCILHHLIQPTKQSYAKAHSIANQLENKNHICIQVSFSETCSEPTVMFILLSSSLQLFFFPL